MGRRTASVGRLEAHAESQSPRDRLIQVPGFRRSREDRAHKFETEFETEFETDAPSVALERCSFPFVFTKLRCRKGGTAGAASPIAERVADQGRPIVHCMYLGCGGLRRPHGQNQLTAAVRTIPFLHNLG
jgi:hypothetical protein